jgi:hypothetical protein
MIPTIAQQLNSLKLRMEETIIPELPQESRFAREQARFIVTALEWLLDTHQHEYRYEVVENVEYRKLLGSVLDESTGCQVDDEHRQALLKALEARGPGANEAVTPVDAIRSQNREMKALAADIFRSLSARHGAPENPARPFLEQVARSQVRRELAFFKKTGWVDTPDALGELLGQTATV